MTDEWLHTTLGGTAAIYGGGTPSTKEPAYWGGEIVWLTPTEVVRADGQRISASERTITESGLTNSSAKLLPRGSVLLTTRASVGYVAISDAPVCTNQGFQSLVPNDQVLPEFLMYWIQGNRDEFTSRAGGSTFPEISKSKVADIPIAIPPLPVQRRIVDLMAHLDNHLANLRAERACAQDVETGSLAALVSQFEESGKSRPLSEYAEVFDCEHKTAPACDDSEAFGLSIGTRDIRNGLILPEGAKRVSEATWLAWSRRVQVRHQDVVMAREAPVGPLAVVTPDLPPLCLGQRTVLIRPGAGVNSDVLSGVLRSSSMQAWMRSKSAGLTVTHLNVADIKQMPIPQLPGESRQDVLGGAVVSMLNYPRHLSEEIGRVECIRSALLGSLLNRQSEIPDSYDLLLPEMA